MVLLNTSPVRDVEIIAGKFLSSLVFLCLMLAMTVYTVLDLDQDRFGPINIDVSDQPLMDLHDAIK